MTTAERDAPRADTARLQALAVMLAGSGAVFLSSFGAYFLLYPGADPLPRIVALVAGAVGVVLFSAGCTGLLTGPGNAPADG